MTYTVLARRYRSTSFGQVIGQEPIAQTLRNAIAQGKVHHALLFTGTRGVGKTSMARIFARALNAPDTVEDCPASADADSFPPQDVQQRMADAIMRGDDLNVIEIDGASNRRVVDARQLIEGAGLTPTSQARYKIYIIDEVHMLTGEAFNTLLKTMEEPPAHVKFILCTTESHKVPPTIQSRCQRFDFRNIPARQIAEHLRFVLDKEQIEADDAALLRIARLANGSMRDALSLMDRLIAATTPQQPGMTLELLEQMLGLPPQQLVEHLVDALADGDIKAALTHTAALLDRGLAQDQVIDALVEHLRELMLLAACGADCPMVELADDARAQAVQRADRFDAPGLVHMIALCENLQRFGRASANPRALLDATIVRLALAEKMADVAALLKGGAPPAPKKKEALDADRPAAVPARPAPPTQHAPTPSASRPAPVAARPPEATRAAPDTAPEKANAAHDEPDAVWSAVLDAVAHKASMSWVASLCLQSIDQKVVHLTTAPGRRELMRFVTPQRRDQLAQLFRDVLKRPVQVAMVQNEDAAAQAAPPTGRNRHEVDPQKAFALPLVKQVLEQFDAVVVDTRLAQQKQEQEQEKE